MCEVALRAGLHYGQTSRGEAFGPMKMQKCPKSVLSAFTLEAKVQRTSPPKEPKWQHFRKLWRQEYGLSSTIWVEQNDPNFRREAEFFLLKYSKSGPLDG